MKSSTHSKGKEAEQYVIAHLCKKGWVILANNYKADGGEIDIIALDGQELVIVEVKSGMQNSYALSESVTVRKRERIEKAANHFIYRNRMNHRSIRFEVITVTMPDKKIHHFHEEFFDS